MWFEAMSGLRVNLDKKELILVGRVENVEELAREFGCKFSTHSSSYLVFLWVLVLRMWQFGMRLRKG